MATESRRMRDRVLDAGMRLVSRAAVKVLADPRGQLAVARAVGMAQRGRKQAEAMQQRFMRATGIPGRQDLQDIAKQLARIKRKARELAERLEAEQTSGARSEGNDPQGEVR